MVHNIPSNPWYCAHVLLAANQSTLLLCSNHESVLRALSVSSSVPYQIIALSASARLADCQYVASPWGVTESATAWRRAGLFPVLYCGRRFDRLPFFLLIFWFDFLS